MGFYAPAQLVRDAQEHGVEVRPIDVNASRWDCTLEDGALRLGLRMIVGLPQAQAETNRSGQTAAPFRSLGRFCRRSGCAQRGYAAGRADAFCSLRARSPRLAVASAGRGKNAARAMSLFANLDHAESPVGACRRLEAAQEVFADYRTAGLSLRAHPMSFDRDRLKRLGIVPAARLATIWPMAASSAWRASCWCGSVPARPRASRSSRWKTKPARRI